MSKKRRFLGKRSIIMFMKTKWDNRYNGKDHHGNAISR